MRSRQAGVTRQQAIQQRQVRIEQRLSELSARRSGLDGLTHQERAELARRHARESAAAAYQAVIFCRDALAQATEARARAAAAQQRAIAERLDGL